MVSVTTTAVTLPLLPILQRAFPDVTSYQIDKNIVQSNAEGFCLTAISSKNIANEIDDASLNSSAQCQGISTTATCSRTSTSSSSSDESKSNESSLFHHELFVKCVEATKYSNRPWADLRRTLLYSRTEARFYSDILPLLQEVSMNQQSSPSKSTRNNPVWGIAPKCYLAESSLADLIGEDESTAAKSQHDTASSNDPKYDSDDISILVGKGGNLVLESLSQSYYQTSPLEMSQAKQCISAIAKFHAFAFENQDILQSVSSKLCQNGGSYHLTNRNPKELANICQTWDDIVMNLKDAPDLPTKFFERDGIHDLGQRVQNVAEYVSNVLSPNFDEAYATIVHGDYKAMNVFLPLKDEDEPLLIDFASVGVGLGVSDIAMHIPHALHPDDLDNGGEEELVEHYYKIFQEALPASKKNGCGSSYTYEQFWRHYKFARVDYFRFILGRMWKGLSMEVFEKRKNLKNFAEFNRTLEAALAFIIRVDKYLVEIEEEIRLPIS